jgi:hypothetical protein
MSEKSVDDSVGNNSDDGSQRPERPKLLNLLTIAFVSVSIGAAGTCLLYLILHFISWWTSSDGENWVNLLQTLEGISGLAVLGLGWRIFECKQTGCHRLGHFPLGHHPKINGPVDAEHIAATYRDLNTAANGANTEKAPAASGLPSVK